MNRVKPGVQRSMPQKYQCVVSIVLALITSTWTHGKMSADEVKGNVSDVLRMNQCVLCNLQNADLRRAELKGVNLCGANLDGALFDLAVVKEANLQYSSLKGTSFHGADLSYADLQGALWDEAEFSGAYMKFTTIGDSEINRTNLTKEQLEMYCLGSGEVWQRIDHSISHPPSDVPAVPKRLPQIAPAGIE